MTDEQSRNKIMELESEVVDLHDSNIAKDGQIAALTSERDAALARERHNNREIEDLRTQIGSWKGGTIVLGSVLMLAALATGKGKIWR